MPGHLFIVQADLTRLEVDALAIPSDQRRMVERSWLEHAPKSVRSHRAERFADVEQGDVVRWRAWDDGRAAYLVDVGRARQQEPGWYAKRALAFLDAAATDVSAREGRRRARALIGLPVFGSRHGGAETIAGAVIAALVTAVHEKVRGADWDHDVVLAVASHDTFAACQRVRRRLAEATAERSDGLATRLAENAVDGNLVLFVGAGVSMGAGLPGWRALLDELADGAAIPADVRTAMKPDEDGQRRISLLDEARIIADAYSAKEKLGEAIEARLRSDRYALTHALLASMPVNEVVTTNYDTLFEMAATGAGRPAAVLPYEPVAHGHRWLLKMHGTIDPPRDIVLTREDYLDYGRTRGALLGIVQAMLITRHMLFVGFSLDDDNFIRIAHDVRAALPKRDPERAPKFGTVLTLEEDPARRLVWERDFDITAMDARGDGDLATPARDLEILLDDVLARSRPELSHLMKPEFAGVLDPEERDMSAALIRLAGESTDSPAWKPVRDFLARFGSR
jgi:hypothetical protein